MDLNIAKKKYEIDEKIDILLEALIFIQENKNSSLGFKHNCRSGVCGSCAVRVNGIEKLACVTKINDGDSIEPLKNLSVIKDLIIDSSNINEKINLVDTSLNNKNNIDQLAIDSLDTESNCILCNACYSSCPVYDYNKEFIGPFALTRAYRYYMDQREDNNSNKLQVLQSNGVWDCTLCGNCSAVCPQSIDIKSDIQKLQNSSVQSGFENPHFAQAFSGGFGDDNFGFNPSGF